MPDPVRVLTTNPVPPVTVNTPATPTLVSVIDEQFVRKSDLSEGAVINECYVIDGGNSAGQPCDE